VQVRAAIGLSGTIAGSIGLVIAFRVLQGVFGAMLQPTALALLRLSCPASRAGCSPPPCSSAARSARPCWARSFLVAAAVALAGALVALLTERGSGAI
jgi:MFS family permease